MLRDEDLGKEKENIINEIPMEMRVHIFSFMDFCTLPKIPQVCSLWRTELTTWQLLGFKSQIEAEAYSKLVDEASDYNTALHNRSDTTTYIIVSKDLPWRDKIFKLGLPEGDTTRGSRSAQIDGHTIHLELSMFGYIQDLKCTDNPEADFIFLIPLDKRDQLDKYLDQLANIEVRHLAFFIVDEAKIKELAPLPKNTILLSKSDDLESFHAKVEKKILDLNHPDQPEQKITPFTM